jgi:hypothetical protein
MNQPKRHHYLNRAILANFATADENVQVYDRARNEYRAQIPQQIGCENHLYRTEPDQDGNVVNLEPILSKIDDAGFSVLRKLHSQSHITTDDFNTLAYFIALQNARLPGYMDDIGNAEGEMMTSIFHMMMENEQSIRHFFRHGPKGKMSEDEFVAMSLKHGKSIVSKPTKSRKLAIMDHSASESAKVIVECFSGVKLMIPEEGSSFITSDCPLVSSNRIQNISSPGLAHLKVDGTYVVYSTHPQCLIELSRETTGVSVCSVRAPGVRSVNKFLAHFSNRFVFGQSKANLEAAVADAEIAGKPPTPRLTLH